MSAHIKDAYIKNAYALFFTDAIVDKEEFSSREDITLPMLKELIALKIIDESCTTLNPNVTVEYIETNPLYGWDYYALSKNKNITLEFYEKHKDEKWDEHSLYTINKNFLQKGLRSCSGSIFSCLSRNPALTWEIVLQYKEKPWDWNAISCYVRLDRKAMEIISSSPFLVEHIIWSTISYRKGLEWILIEKHVHLPWNFSFIAIMYSGEIPLHFVGKYVPITSIVWDIFCQRKDLTLEYVLTHPSFPWKWNMLYMNESVITEQALNTTFAHETIQRLHSLQYNTAISLSYLEQFMNDHVLTHIPSRKDITLEFLKKNYHRLCSDCDDHLSKNPCITEEIVKEIPAEWSIEGLASNENISVAFIIDMFVHEFERVQVKAYTSDRAEQIIEQLFKRKNLTYKDIVAMKVIAERITNILQPRGHMAPQGITMATTTNQTFGNFLAGFANMVANSPLNNFQGATSPAGAVGAAGSTGPLGGPIGATGPSWPTSTGRDDYFNLLQKYVFRNPKQSATIIQRVWRRYFHRKMQRQVCAELSILPPTENGWFLGGEEYRKSFHDFQGRSQRSQRHFVNHKSGKKEIEEK